MFLIAGLMRGFMLESYALISWLLATVIGLGFCREFSALLTPTINDPSAKIAAAFVSLFLITLIVGGLIRILLGELVKKSELTVIDRLGGMIFGVSRSVVLIAIIVMLAGVSVLPASPWWKQSTLLPPFQSIAVWLRDHIPSELAKYVHYR